MLPLLERIVAHLERVQRVADKEVVDREVPLEFSRFEGFVLDLFERTAGGDRKAANRLDRYWRWEPVYLRAFVEELHWGLLDGVGARWSATDRFGLIEAGLQRASMLDGEAGSEPFGLPRTRIMTALLTAAQESIGHSVESWRHRAPWNVAPHYCERLGLTRSPATVPVVTPAGATLVRLRGIDRLRWILAVETSLATSAWDTWCTDLGSVRYLARGKGWTITGTDPEGFPVSDSTFERWTEFGALERWDDEQYDVYGYGLTAVGQDLFGEVARDDATSFRTLARALFEDEREQILAPTPEASSPDRATAATLRHARMVAHEVRNALLPVQHALKKIWAIPAVAKIDLSEPRRRVDDGLARLHRFVDDSLRLAPGTMEDSSPFSIMAVIDEARRQCTPSPEGGISIETRPANADPYIRGHRGRLVLALLNLFRNAVQAGGARVRIQISVDAREPDRATLRIRDNGPGIPDERRANLFENGVSHRPGGSGHGLSLVRSIVEDEMRGRVRLAPPTEDGACFELLLPTEPDKSKGAK